MRTIEIILYVPKELSDSIRGIFIGPFVDALARTFADMDRVRREGGFEKPYVSAR